MVPSIIPAFLFKNKSASIAEGYGFPIKFEVSVAPIGIETIPLFGTPLKTASYKAAIVVE